jgi:membrane-bound lytic murein transglycosylase D
LPLEVTDAVVGYIEFFSTDRGRRVLVSGYARAGRYRDMIAREFAAQGLPDELIFVAQLESHFNPTAVSSAKAVGMWQFMSFTGKEYDLTIDRVLDERRDPAKATRAAAQYLLDLYRRYGDWYLAMAAYNCGAGCVDRAILRTGYADFWELRRLRALPLATTNYVPEILAMTIMHKNAKAYGIELEPDPMLEYDDILLESETSLDLVAAAIDRPVGQIKQLNPALLQMAAPKGYALHLPAGEGETLQAAFEAVPASLRKTGRIHRFNEEDTWTSVAKKYGTTVARLMELNPAFDQAVSPEAGRFAAIPPKAAPVKAAPAKKAAPKKASTAKAQAPKRNSGKTAAKTPTKAAPQARAKDKKPAKNGAGA